MKNVTITLDEEVARWARILAAKNDTSVSRLLGEMLRERMLAEANYEAAARQFLSLQPRALSDGDEPYPDRDELHDRAGLR